AIGARQTQRLFLTGERIGGQEGLALGLVNKLVDDDKLDEEIARITNDLLLGAASAQAASIDLIRRLTGITPSMETVALTSVRIAELRASAEGREGVNAFLE